LTRGNPSGRRWPTSLRPGAPRARSPAPPLHTPLQRLRKPPLRTLTRRSRGTGEGPSPFRLARQCRRASRTQRAGR
tara:strand:- start:31 stop:258 length:228 start_codon:yes stop_codon:yes gene_type:complete